MLIKPIHSFQKPVYHDHDGSEDDFVSLITLLTLDKYRLTGISVTNANCYAEIAVESTLRILELFCRKDVEVAISSEQSINSFPDEWRKNKEFINFIEVLSKQKVDRTRISKMEAADFMAEKILAETEKTTIVLTGPASNLAIAIEKYPEIIGKIEKVLWMAGAFMVDGNVKSPDHDGSAEWNIFWNPNAASSLLKSGIPIVLFPLDACKQLPVDNYVMYQLKHTESQLSELVHQLFESNYKAHLRYYMWDVLPVVYLGNPGLFQFETSFIDVELRGTSRGNIYRSSKGNKVKYAKFIKDDDFYDYFLDQLTQF
ncbi:MAG: nucleoside hydrolase [Prolixibacteraceae bacterium]